MIFNTKEHFWRKKCIAQNSARCTSCRSRCNNSKYSFLQDRWWYIALRSPMAHHFFPNSSNPHEACLGMAHGMPAWRRILQRKLLKLLKLLGSLCSIDNHRWEDQCCQIRSCCQPWLCPELQELHWQPSPIESSHLWLSMHVAKAGKEPTT